MVKFYPWFARCRGCGLSDILNRDGLCEQCENDAMSALEAYYQHETDSHDDERIDGKREL
jgi:hypothetical protein